MIIPKLILIFLAVFSLSYLIAIVIVELKLRYDAAREQERRDREPDIRRFWNMVNEYSTESIRPSGGTISPSPSANLWVRVPNTHEFDHRGKAITNPCNPCMVLEDFLTKEEMEI